MQPDQALELAKEAERFVNSLRLDRTEAPSAVTSKTATLNQGGNVSNVEGIKRWRRIEQSSRAADDSIYHGSAGIGLFALELASATGIAEYAANAVDAANLVAASVSAQNNASVAFATGWPGYAFALKEFAGAVGTPAQKLAWRSAASMAVDKLAAQSSPAGNGVAWIEPMPFSDITGFSGDREIYDLSVGGAGAAIALLDLVDTEISPNALSLAVAAGERLLEVAVKSSDGWRWDLMNDLPFPFMAPNFAHGGAGVGYVMAQLFDRTHDERHLEAAVQAARYTMSRASDVGDGCLVCHTEQQQPPQFYLGACHGPAGTGRLLLTLERLTGDKEWREQLQGLYRGLKAIGAPATRSWGWWQNHSQCCGDAGLGDFALLAYEATKDQQWFDLAHECAEVLMNASTVGLVAARGLGGLGLSASGGSGSLDSGGSGGSGGSGSGAPVSRWWVQAEHRARPDFLQAQTGYMQGAAGIGSFFVHLATAEWANPVRVRFPDQYL